MRTPPSTAPAARSPPNAHNGIAAAARFAPMIMKTTDWTLALVRLGRSEPSATARIDTATSPALDPTEEPASSTPSSEPEVPATADSRISLARCLRAPDWPLLETVSAPSTPTRPAPGCPAATPITIGSASASPQAAIRRTSTSTRCQRVASSSTSRPTADALRARRCQWDRVAGRPTSALPSSTRT
ncbi:MAG TPA: hypothetical protein VFN19_05220 [Candidatus Nanopelagicales bacterium]|nr:hypothetical protein [Candidatus Nanopelagicales bacterium]